MGQDDLHQQFLSLNEYLNYLGTQLANASDCLLEDGTLPSQKLIDELVTARADFDRFRSRVLAETHDLDLLPAPELDDDIRSLRDLESLLHHIAQAEKAKAEAEAIRQRALALLARVRTIEHAECEHFTPLIDIQNNVGEIGDAISNARWSDLPSETPTLANGSHPFATLLTLVEQHAELDDDTWVGLQEIVSQSFGKSMSVAAARGKLFLNETAAAEDEEDATQGSAEPPLTPPPTNDVEKTLRETDVDASQVVHDKSVFDMPDPSRPPEASTAMMTDIQNLHEEAAQYGAPPMKQAVLDRFLKEQLDAVRRDVAGRQKQTFIKSIGRRIRS
jgi:hypothetical protein